MSWRSVNSSWAWRTRKGATASWPEKNRWLQGLCYFKSVTVAGGCRFLTDGKSWSLQDFYIPWVKKQVNYRLVSFSQVSGRSTSLSNVTHILSKPMSFSHVLRDSTITFKVDASRIAIVVRWGKPLLGKLASQVREPRMESHLCF